MISKKLTFEQAQGLCNDLTDGMTNDEASIKYGISVSHIYVVLQDYGLRHKKNRKDKTRKESETLISLYENGNTMDEIEEITGVPHSTCYRILKENGVLIRGRSVRVPKDFKNKEYLEKEYTVLKKPCCQVAREMGVSGDAIKRQLVKFDIPLRENPIQDAFDMGYLTPLRGADNPNFGKQPPHGRGEWVENGGERYFLRSSWEKIVFDYFVKEGINFKYETKRFHLGNATYLPDFFIYNDKNKLEYIIEVKGWVKDKDIQKLMLFETLYPEIPILFWTKPEIEKLKLQLKEVA